MIIRSQTLTDVFITGLNGYPLQLNGRGNRLNTLPKSLNGYEIFVNGREKRLNGLSKTLNGSRIF